MTLYLLFERLEAGKLKLDSDLEVSAHAPRSRRPSSGCGRARPSRSRTRSKASSPRSANDAAVVVAESLADSEEEFARMMTRKAQALGMSRTVYKNANGLPSNDQVTTRRDQAILGRAIRNASALLRFFSTRVFVFAVMPSATTITCSGVWKASMGSRPATSMRPDFNIVTSVHRGNRISSQWCSADRAPAAAMRACEI